MAEPRKPNTQIADRWSLSIEAILDNSFLRQPLGTQNGSRVTLDLFDGHGPRKLILRDSLIRMGGWTEWWFTDGSKFTDQLGAGVFEPAAICHDNAAE